MKSRFMFCFKGRQLGWVGAATTYTITTTAETQVEAMVLLRKRFTIEKVRSVRKLKDKE